MMKQYIAHISLVVNDYDEAISYYTEKFGFELAEDSKLTETKRWVLLAPPGSEECKILLAKAANDEQKRSIGNQTGGRVFLFLYTNNFYRDYNSMLKKGVKLYREAKNEAYGTVAVFEDLYGNLWDLIEPSKK